MAISSFQFGDPTTTPDNYQNFTQAELKADTAVTPLVALQPVPAPSVNPPVLSLDAILGTAATAQIQAAGKIAIHVVGDTGGIKEPSHQFAVADAMTADLNAAATYAGGRQAFFYHLGDVVYYCGQEEYYYDQFYDPYRNYNAPIFAIPGNHDGCVFKGGPKTLVAFQQNFCATKPAHNPDAQGVSRSTMTQPGVYFTLNAPFVKIIGLYSNVGEGTTAGVISGKSVGQAQLTFLTNQLNAAAAQRAKAGAAPFALVIATHHPPFTLSSSHAPSLEMLAQIDAACKAAGIWPDMHWSGHAHLYERYTRTVAGRDIPYLVAGMGGYPGLSGLKQGAAGETVQAGATGTDGAGNPVVAECYNNTTFGYLRVNISATTATVEFMGVDEDNSVAQILDSFQLDLTAHKVSNQKAGQPALALKMTTQAPGTKPKSLRKKKGAT